MPTTAKLYGPAIQSAFNKEIDLDSDTPRPDRTATAERRRGPFDGDGVPGGPRERHAKFPGRPGAHP